MITKIMTSRTQNFQALEANDKKEFKKMLIEEKYKNRFEKMQGIRKEWLNIFGIVTIISAATAIFTPKKQEWAKASALLSTVGFGALYGLFYFGKPKKEKYDAAMQKELDEVV